MKSTRVKALIKTIGATLYKNRSNIEFVAGNLMVVGGTAMVISKAEEAVEVKKEFEFAKKEIELKTENNDWDSDKERSKASFKATKDAAFGYAKCYGPGLAVEAGGLVLISISKATDRKELAVTSAALASTTLEFANYRQRVKEELGEAKDEEFYLGKNVEVVNEDGTISVNEDALPTFAIAFTRDNPFWTDDAEMNFNTIENQQRLMNVHLQKQGIMYGNDIRRWLHMKIDPRLEGWGITAVDDDGNTNYIDFGLYRDTGRAAAFRDGTTLTEAILDISFLERDVNSKLYRLMKYHNDWDCELAD